MKFSWVLVFDLGISKGWHTILYHIQWWKLIFSGISKGKVTNLKIPKGRFQKSISTTQHVWSFSEIVPWTGDFHPKSQITILVAHQLELFQKKFQTGGRVEAGFPTGVESMVAVPLLPHWGGLFKIWWKGAWRREGAWREHGRA